MPITYTVNLGLIKFQLNSFSEWLFVVLCLVALCYAVYLLNCLKIGRKLLIALQLIVYLPLTVFFLFLFPPFAIFIIIKRLVPLFSRLNYGNDLSFHAAKGNVQTLKNLILDQHKNFQEPNDSYGWTPLFYAVHNNQEEAADFLLSVGANVNVKDNNGHTPLYYAKTEEMKQILIAFGAKDEKELTDSPKV